MRVSFIRYERLKNLGDYNNERVCVEVVVNEDESPVEAVARAKKFVKRHLEGDKTPYHIERARAVLADPDNNTPNQLKDAREKVDQWEAENGDESEEF